MKSEKDSIKKKIQKDVANCGNLGLNKKSTI
jgi:hypothetical protein